MSQQIISRVERIKLFLREYYLGNTKWINAMRLIGGPSIIAIGVQFYNKSDRVAVAYGGFCFLFGIYYVLKPLLIVVLQPALFQKLIFDLSFDEQGLTLQEDRVISTVSFASFKSILRQSGYYALKLPGKITFYLQADQLTEAEQAILNKHLTA